MEIRFEGSVPVLWRSDGDGGTDGTMAHYGKKVQYEAESLEEEEAKSHVSTRQPWLMHVRKR